MGGDRSLGGVRYRRAPTVLLIKTCPHNFQSDDFHTVKRSQKICWKDWSAKSSIFKKYFHHALWNTQPGTRKNVFWISCVTPVLILITPKLPLKTCGIWLNFQIITDFDKSVRIWLKFHRFWLVISGGEWCYDGKFDLRRGTVASADRNCSENHPLDNFLSKPSSALILINSVD